MAGPGAVNDISGLSCRFAVKWSIPVEDLRYQIPPPGEVIEPRIIRSHIYRFKDVKNLEFSLYLICRQNDNRNLNQPNDYEMGVNCRIDMPIFLVDALVLIEDGIYRVKCEQRDHASKGSVFHSMILAQDRFTCESVTFHCVMSVPVKVEGVITNPTENPSVQDIVDCEVIVCDPGVHRDGYDDVSEFLFSCRIPDFNVDMAVRMMREAQLREIPLLKALCIEYLRENITAENVVTVLNQSVESDAKELSRACVAFLAGKCKVVAQVDLETSLGS